MNATYEMLELQLQGTAQMLAEARRDLAAVKEALALREAEVSRARPVADAAHAYCRVELDEDSHAVEVHFWLDQLLAAHRATTPSPEPATHTIVEVAALERLCTIETAAREYLKLAGPTTLERARQLREALDGAS